MTLRDSQIKLWGQLTALRIDIKLLEMSDGDPVQIVELKMRALQVAVQLKAECAKVLQ